MEVSAAAGVDTGNSGRPVDFTIPPGDSGKSGWPGPSQSELGNLKESAEKILEAQVLAVALEAQVNRRPVRRTQLQQVAKMTQLLGQVWRPHRGLQLVVEAQLKQTAGKAQVELQQQISEPHLQQTNRAQLGL